MQPKKFEELANTTAQEIAGKAPRGEAEVTYFQTDNGELQGARITGNPEDTRVLVADTTPENDTVSQTQGNPLYRFSNRDGRVVVPDALDLHALREMQAPKSDLAASEANYQRENEVFDTYGDPPKDSAELGAWQDRVGQEAHFVLDHAGLVIDTTSTDGETAPIILADNDAHIIGRQTITRA